MFFVRLLAKHSIDQLTNQASQTWRLGVHGHDASCRRPQEVEWRLYPLGWSSRREGEGILEQ